jgi:hypothetical protein
MMHVPRSNPCQQGFSNIMLSTSSSVLMKVWLGPTNAVLFRTDTTTVAESSFGCFVIQCHIISWHFSWAVEQLTVKIKLEFRSVV